MQPQVSRPLRLMLIDEDPIFRQALRLCLQPYPDLELIIEDTDGAIALQMLETARGFSSALSPELPPIETLDLVIIDLGLGRSDLAQTQGLLLCQRFKGQYLDLPVLILSSAPESVLLSAAQQAGANGYCPKGLSDRKLVSVIRQVANGRNCWIPVSSATNSQTDSRTDSRTDSQTDSQTNSRADSRANSPMGSSAHSASNFSARPTQPLPTGIRRDRPTASQRPSPSQPLAGQLNAFDRIRYRLRRSGISQIEALMDELSDELKNLDLSLLDRAVIAGRYRELRAARGLVNWLLATPGIDTDTSPNPQRSNPGMGASVNPRVQADRSSDSALNSMGQAQSIQPVAGNAGAIQVQSTANIEAARDLRSLLFDAVSNKLQTNLDNQTETALETDILRLDKKRELFYLILRQIETLLDELRYSQVTPELLVQKQSSILQDLWQSTLVDFLGKYYTLSLAGLEIEVAEVLLRDEAIVQGAILNRIPGIVSLIRHLLFQTPLMVDGTPYPPGSPDALLRAEQLLENWMIQLANAVMQPLLNRFANVEAIKHNFYDRRLLSVREIERFRNNLSWKYRLEQWVQEPQDIFESQYHVWVLTGRGIQRTTIYAPRYEELEDLEGFQRVVTLALETRDAIAPRLRSVVSWVGNGFIYVLTDVIGRGIGLIGKGVLKGIGNAWQDNRFSRK